MQCLQCQHENRDAAKFCERCGSPMALRYFACGNDARPEAVFCDTCGMRLNRSTPAAPEAPRSSQGESPSARPPSPEAERRQITVMFYDLVGSTKLSAQLDPEEYRDVVRAYQAVCADVIQRFDGHIAQYLGDGLLVYFGYPRAHEDDATRAVQASLDSLIDIGALNTRLAWDNGLQIAVRIGIHTGPVVVGEIGSRTHQERLAMGETPNIASRIQGLAEPGAAVLSASTYRLIRDQFDCQELGLQSLRGIAAPMMLYRVLGEREWRNRFAATLTQPLPPMVGRDAEAAKLGRCWRRVREGAGHVILLSGEAGIGKSRLVQELKTQVMAERHIWLECRCLPYHQHSALYPLIELLQRLLQLRREDTPDEQLSKVERMLRLCHMPLAETVPLFAELLELVIPSNPYSPLDLTPQQQRRKTLDALLSILSRLAAQRPTVFIMEGLHWIDPSTLEFLHLLIHRGSPDHVLALLTYRPDFKPPWRSGDQLTTIALSRLTRDHVNALVSQLTAAKSLPSELHSHIVARADGIPLFVEELTKMVLESGLLRDGPEHYELVDAIPALSIPTTLQDSLMARLDRLPTARGVAQLGAVIGRQFPYALLQAVSQLDDATLQRELDRLINAELLYQHGELLQATYIFKHALIQEAAYQSLLRSTRQYLHQRIAEVLTTQFPKVMETQPELLAHHATEAGLTEQAMAYWQRAGQRALQRSANVEATAHFQRGLTLLETRSDSLERRQQELTLRTALAPALIATHGFAAPDVFRTYTRVRELYQQLGETSELFPVLRGLWVCSEVRAELQTARTLAEQLLDYAQRFPDPERSVEAHRAFGNTFFWLGAFETARDHLERGLALCEAGQHDALAFLYGTDPGVVCAAYAAWAWWLLGFPDRALASSQRALDLAHNLSHAHSLAAALNWAGVLHQLRREKSAAYERAEALLDLARAQEFPHWLAAGVLLRGWAVAMQGQTEAGIGQIHQGLDAYHATGAQIQRPHGLALQAEAYAKAERYQYGLKALDAGLRTADDTGESWYRAELYRLKGVLQLAASAEAQAEAETCFRRALDTAQRQHAKSLELRAAMDLSRLWRKQGKAADARELLAPIYNWFTEGFDTADLQEAKALLQEL